MSATGRTAGSVAMRSLYLVKGDDESLVAQAARQLVDALVADDDPALVVEEFGGPGADDLDVGAVVDACTTPPFLVPKRVVVVRDAGRLSAADGTRLAGALADPLPTTALVLVGGGGTVPQALSRLAGAVGEVVDAAVGRGKARAQWLSEHLRHGPVRLDAPAASRLAEHLGGDLGRLSGILETLAVAYGEGATVGVAELEPFLGDAGSVAPWDLTDAIDAGDTGRALEVLHRMLGPGGAHPLQVMGTLHRHYRQLLRLDGSGVATPAQAAEILGIKSTFPAKKALAQGRRLGPSGVARAVRLLGDADLDLRGATAMPGEVVLDVLVGRLSRLVRRAR